MADLRLLNPSRPELSVQYNPFHTEDDNYAAQVSMIFGSFELRNEFFAPHQLKYLADIVRILHYTGKRFNFYDVAVMALDPGVIEEQVAIARDRIARDTSLPSQRRLNFEMSVKNLLQSFADRERVPKIQGLLNECTTFLDDELSIITSSYANLLSLDEVIDEHLILFVSLNINKNTAPVRALGKMLLQNLQLCVGKRYESETERKRKNRPLFSVVMDEFAPFGYRNFAQILNTARGTNTAFLFSMQSLPQLLQVGKGFQQDVSSAPGTTMLLQTRDEETAQYFKQASSQIPVQKRSQQLWRKSFFGFERFEKTTGATEREQLEYRALDHHIKNLGKGKMEILMTDPIKGTLHGRLHVRPPADVRVPCCEPVMFPKLLGSRADEQGANLRFKDQKLAATVVLPRRNR
jgi:type IV secretory pathway TraG/TraD family ATPase VirD4